MSRHLEESIGSIARIYGIRLSRVQPCSSLYKKTAAYKSHTKSGNVLIKPYKGSRSKLERLSARLELLWTSGFRHMPKWLKTRGRCRWAEVNKRLYYISEWIDGYELNRTPVPEKLLQDYQSLGHVLADLHQRSQIQVHPPVSYVQQEIREFKRQHRDFSRKLAMLAGIRTKEGVWLQEHGRRCVAMAEKAFRCLHKTEIARKLNDERPAFIHGDVTLPNIIVNSDRLYFIDWDRARIGSTYFELVKTLSNTAEYSIERISAFLQGYEEVRPLQQADRLIVSSIFRLPREAWITAFKLGRVKHPDIFKVLDTTWNNRLRAIEWMDEWAATPPKQ